MAAFSLFSKALDEFECSIFKNCTLGGFYELACDCFLVFQCVVKFVEFWNYGIYLLKFKRFLYFRNLGQISEGFAEFLPHYLMNFEERNLKHQKAISSFQEKDMLNMAFLNQNGMFAVDEINGRETQQLKSYMSVYLWMLAYTKRVENIYRLNKFEATNFILNEFSKVDNLRWNDKTIAIADMVKMPRDEVMNGLTLQKEGKQYVVNTIIHRKLKQTNSLSK